MGSRSFMRYLVKNSGAVTEEAKQCDDPAQVHIMRDVLENGGAVNFIFLDRKNLGKGARSHFCNGFC